MRTKINLLILTALIISTSLTAIAQADNSATMSNNTGAHKEYSASSTESKMVTGTLPEKLVIHFNHNFPSAVNAKWTTTADAFIVNFTLNEKPVMASFNKKGAFVYALIYGNQANLSVSIQQEIRKNYPSFTVYKVVEIRTPSAVNYQVILQNSTEYADLKVSQDGQIEETKKITKNEG